MHAECVQLGAAGEVPEHDGEVHPARHEMVRVVARRVVQRVQEAVHPSRVTLQHLSLQRICKKKSVWEIIGRRNF